MQQPQQNRGAPTSQAPGLPADLPRLSSRELLRGRNLVLIDHGGETYFLRQTRNNRLILTK